MNVSLRVIPILLQQIFLKLQQKNLQGRKFTEWETALKVQSGIPEFLDHGRKNWTLDSGRWTLTLDFGCWTLDTGFWTLDSGRWTLDTVVDCCRTESEPSFWFCLIKWLKIFSMRISKDHGYACSVEAIGWDVAIFRNSILTLSVTL